MSTNNYITIQYNKDIIYKNRFYYGTPRKDIAFIKNVGNIIKPLDKSIQSQNLFLILKMMIILIISYH